MTNNPWVKLNEELWIKRIGHDGIGGWYVLTDVDPFGMEFRYTQDTVVLGPKDAKVLTKFLKKERKLDRKARG